MEWKLILKNESPTESQIDEVGNIYQHAGGVIPKACQKCKTKFNAKIKSVPVTQNVPWYICSCDFKTGDPTEAFDHKLETSHSIKRKPKSRVITYVNTLEGLKANIRKIYKDKEVTDVTILCDNCI